MSFRLIKISYNAHKKNLAKNALLRQIFLTMIQLGWNSGYFSEDGLLYRNSKQVTTLIQWKNSGQNGIKCIFSFIAEILFLFQFLLTKVKPSSTNKVKIQGFDYYYEQMLWKPLHACQVSTITFYFQLGKQNHSAMTSESWWPLPYRTIYLITICLL